MSAHTMVFESFEEQDAWELAKDSPLVDTLVEAVVISLVALFANITFFLLESMATLPSAVG